MTIYVLKIDGEIRGLFTDVNACYRIVNDYEKGGPWDIDVTPVEANQLTEEPIIL